VVTYMTHVHLLRAAGVRAAISCRSAVYHGYHGQSSGTFLKQKSASFDRLVYVVTFSGFVCVSALYRTACSLMYAALASSTATMETPTMCGDNRISHHNTTPEERSNGSGTVNSEA
jgi:hypothetical protein